MSSREMAAKGFQVLRFIPRERRRDTPPRDQGAINAGKLSRQRRKDRVARAEKADKFVQP